MKTPKNLKNLLKNRILAHFSKQLATKSKKYIFSYGIYEFLMFWARNSRLKILEFLSKNSRIPKPKNTPKTQIKQENSRF